MSSAPSSVMPTMTVSLRARNGRSFEWCSRTVVRTTPSRCEIANAARSRAHVVFVVRKIVWWSRSAWMNSATVSATRSNRSLAIMLRL